MNQFYAIVSKVCAWTLFVMTILGALNAVLRYSSRFTGQVWSSNAFLEGQWYLFSAVFLLGAGYTLSKTNMSELMYCIADCPTLGKDV